MTYTVKPVQADRVGWTTNGEYGAAARLLGAVSVANVSTAWPGSNNDAYAFAMLLSLPTTFTGAFFFSGTSPGTTTFDIGIYRSNFSRVASLGSTASVNTTNAIIPVGGGTFTNPVTLPRGRYWVAMSSASTALTVIAPTVTLNSTPRLLGWFKMASAHPLPSTFVPATVGTLSFLPTVGLLTPGMTVL